MNIIQEFFCVIGVTATLCGVIIVLFPKQTQRIATLMYGNAPRKPNPPKMPLVMSSISIKNDCYTCLRVHDNLIIAPLCFSFSNSKCVWRLAVEQYNIEREESRGSNES